MGTVTTLPREPFTRSDLDAMPDDGHRYELVDGTLVVSAAPSTRHQTAVVELLMRLRSSCPAELKVLVAPFDVVLTADTVLQPDLLVARRADLTERDLPTAPVLAVEVLSKSTRRVDTTLKRSRLEAAGCASYWVVDPDDPELIAWELRDGAYVEVAHVTGEEPVTAAQPYPLEFSPVDLVG